jgi:hypothetical protein
MEYVELLSRVINRRFTLSNLIPSVFPPIIDGMSATNAHDQRVSGTDS